MYKITLIAFLAIALSACQNNRIEGNGNVKTETREAAPFQSLEVEGSFEVTIHQGNYSSVEVKADENLLQYIKTYVQGGTLHIKSDKNFSNYKSLTVDVNIDNLEKIEASGSSTIRSEGPSLNGKKVKLDFSGGTEANLNLICEKMESDLSGACKLNLRGKADQASYDCSGSVEINAGDFKTRECDLDMSGSGDAVVFVTENLEVEVSGSAKVEYRGNPGKVKQDISGVATIKPID